MASDQKISPNRCLIDSSIYIFQYYFSLPDNWFSEKQQYPTAAVYGFTSFLCKLREAHQPEYVAACFDESLGGGFREQIFPGYKSSRALPDKALAFQLQHCQIMAGYLGIPCFASKRYEADDLIGCLLQSLQSEPAAVAILSRDKDLAQLLHRPQDFVWDYAKDKRCYQGDVFEKWGVEPDQIEDYLALVGDNIDDIPGVPGVGGKTAAALLAHFGNVEQLFGNLDQCQQLKLRGSRTLAEKLEGYDEQVQMAKQLATIVTDVDLIESVDQLRWREPQWDKLELLCEELGFPKMFKRIGKVFDR